MNVGVLLRCNQRGLAVQTQAVARHLDARVLVIDVPNQSSRAYPTQTNGDAPIVSVGAGWTLPERPVRRWLEGLDAVYTAESCYDDRFTDWARAAGAVTVCHLNPEFTAPDLRGWGIGRPDGLWSATPWRLAHLPAAVEVVPMPVNHPPQGVEHHDGPARLLHLAGKRALRDRNGTDALLAALPLLREPCSVTVCCQDGALPLPAVPSHVEVRSLGPMADLTGGWLSHDVLVMPRRYGGLSLPVGEAMAHGLAVLMPDIPPNREAWPVATFPASFGVPERMPAGMVEVAEIDPHKLAAAMDAFAGPVHRKAWQEESVWWATENRWEVAAPRWLERLANLQHQVHHSASLT